MPLAAGVADSATYTAFGGITVLSKQLAAASSNSICLFSGGR